jgi:hypothetical protein
MGVSMKEGEGACNDNPEPNRCSRGKHDEEPEHDDRASYCRLDEGSAQAQDRGGESDQDHRNEGHRPGPQRAAARDDAPQSNCEHRKDVVCATEGMCDPR